LRRETELRVPGISFRIMHAPSPAGRLLPIVAAALLAPHLAFAAACHDEADRLAGKHALNADAPKLEANADAASPRIQAQQALSAARKADEDGIVEECLRQLAQARALIETTAPSSEPTPNAPQR
jgi:hypothetical protein